MITEGDTLLEVNGENVRGLSLQTVAPMITGPLNTPVQLGFKPGKEAREAGLEHVQRFIQLSRFDSVRGHWCAQVGTRRRSTTRWTLSAHRSTPSVEWTLASATAALGRRRRNTATWGSTRSRRSMWCAVRPNALAPPYILFDFNTQ